jgi:hypothetical protein
MKSTAAGALSGAAVWVLTLGAAFACLCPAAVFVGGISASLGSGSVAGILEPYLCPDGSAAEIVTYQTTTTDDFGNTSPATAYEMQCVGASGEIAREPSPDYAFYWMGALIAGSLLLSLALAFLLAAPAGLLFAAIARRMGRGGGTAAEG